MIDTKKNPKIYKLMLEYTKKEIEILEKLNHPNIVKLHDHVQKGNIFYIILELCHNGDLSEYI